MRNSVILFLLFVAAAVGLAAPQDVARSIFQSTVMITTQDQKGRPLAIGSGFVLKPGFIVSNFHVVEGAGSGFVKLVGDTGKYKISGIAARDEPRDLVILGVDGVSARGALLSERAGVEVGETVYAIGNPRGLEGTFSQGIVSSIRALDGLTLLQITAPISPGSSGGPIADEKGHVIGVAVATFRGGQNLNFAIPVKYVAELAASLAKPVPLSDAKLGKAGASLFSQLDSGKSTDGVTVGNFLWVGGISGTPDRNGAFTISVKNNLQTPIRDIRVLVLFHNRSGEIVDSAVVQWTYGAIAPGLAKRATGGVDPSIKRLTTPISPNNQFMYADEPTTKIEYRVLGFELENLENE
jgi:S1-C subfamily serine protease